MVINMENGETAQQIIFDEQDPEYLVDERSGRVYFYPQKSVIKTLNLGSAE